MQQFTTVRYPLRSFENVWDIGLGTLSGVCAKPIPLWYGFNLYGEYYMDIMMRGGLDTQSYRIVSEPITGSWYYVKWNDGLEQWKARADVNADIDYTMEISNKKVGV